MVGQKQNNNTPVRNRKVGLPDPQGNGGQAQQTVATTGPSKMVQQMAAQNFAMKNGGQQQVMSGAPNSKIPAVGTVNPNIDFFANGNRVAGKYEAPAMNASQKPQIRGGNGVAADGSGAYVPMNQGVQGQNAATADYAMGSDNQGGQPVVRHSDGSVAATPAPIQNGAPSVASNPTDTGQNDLSSLSAALNGATQQPQQAQFQADPTQKDGGFFNWVKGLIPKKRPGKREGETDDEYDARRTRNMQMMATFADAIRHMGNIINTSKGAPLQQFNDPSTMLEQGRQARKAERQKQAAADAKQAYNLANLSIKDAAQKAQEKYQEFQREMQKDKFDWQKDQDKVKNKQWKDEFDRKNNNDTFNHTIKQAEFNFKVTDADRKFNENVRHNRTSEGLSAQRNAISEFNARTNAAKVSNDISGGSVTKYDNNPINAPKGRLVRKNALSSMDRQSAMNYMFKHGFLTPEAMKAYKRISDQDGKNAKIDSWISIAAMRADKEGNAFRDYLQKQLGYKFVKTGGSTGWQVKRTPIKSNPKKAGNNKSALQ